MQSTNIFPEKYRNRYFIFLFSICCIGFLLRVSVSAELLNTYPSVSKPAKTTDMYTYKRYAKQILDGSFDYNKGFYYQPFYYTCFLPLVYWVKDSPWSIILAQSLLGTITIFLVGIMSTWIFGKKAGILAALLCALDRYLIFYTPFLLLATLQAFWISLLLVFALVAAKKQNRRWWFVLGLVHGLAIVTRGNVILFLPALIGWIFYSLRRSRKLFFLAVGAFLFGVILPQIPYSWINYKAYGHWIGSSSAAETVLALGNTPESPPGGREAHAGAGPMEYPETYHQWMAAAQSKPRVSLYHHIIAWMKQEPLAYIELKFRMFLLFWNQQEIPNNVAIQFLDQPIESKILHLPVLLDFAVVGSLGIMGIFLSLLYYPKQEASFLGITIIILYCLSTVLFYILSRFRLPIVPLLCSFGGYALMFSYQKCSTMLQKKAQAKSCFILFLIAIASISFVVYGYDAYRYYWERRVIALVRPYGVQVSFPNRILIQDHGPATFGGWIPVPMYSVPEVEKAFLFDGMLSTEKTIPRIRFPIASVAPTNIKFSVTYKDQQQSQKILRSVSLKKGWNWIEQEFEEVIVIPKDTASLRIILEFQTNSKEVYLYFDNQRFYRRTYLNGRTRQDQGEMVLTLFLQSYPK